MPRLIIDGPCTLSGDIAVRGAKNAALPAILAAAAGIHPVELENVPVDLEDVGVAFEALRHFGCEVAVSEGGVSVVPGAFETTDLPPELSTRFRSSLLFLGLLLGRRGHARVAMPGGCQLGERKFDLHLDGLRRLGARVETGDGYIEASSDGLEGADIDFYLPSTTGTENVMIAACFARGRTRIFNANTRPEIADLGRLLRAMGASVTVRNRVVEVEGPTVFRAARHRVMPGWDEALMYMMGAVTTGGELCVHDFSLEQIRADAAYLRGAGADVFEWGGNVYVSGKEKALVAFDLFTAPYPGVNSDMQPLFAAFASKCAGESTITDQRFTDRFQYVGQLARFGVDIASYGNCAVVRGGRELQGATVTATDLRCGAALVLAALGADGTTVIDNATQVFRGYEQLTHRLGLLGARARVDAEEA